METSRIRTLLCVGLTAVMSGCTTPSYEDYDDLAYRNGSSGGGDDTGRSAPPADDDEDRSGSGDWINNGLISPTVSGVSVLHGLVSSNGLSDDAGWLDGTCDDGLTVVRYLVECALEDGQSISKHVGGQSTMFHGRLGLAPEWRTGACDQECQRWVSACLMARTNPVGQTTEIWLQADHPSIGFGTNPAFPHYEGSFYGNLFATDQVEHTCEGEPAGLHAAELEGRTCVSDTQSCGFASDGDCLNEADCELTPSGSVPATCRPEAGAPSYPVISVHVAEPEGAGAGSGGGCADWGDPV